MSCPNVDEPHQCGPNNRPGLDGGFRAGIDVRVSLRADAGWGSATYDGAWWPRRYDLAAELPELIAELSRRGVRVERFAYSLAAWPLLPRRIAVADGVVRAGGFRSMDPQVVSVTWAGGSRRADLLVVPPETDALTGARALRLCCTRRGLPRSPQIVLATARATPAPQVSVPHQRDRQLSRGFATS
ncbi:DUF5994 family protein [Geodermatophilus ruber]|uniref:Uncharacterized protein n=1 Tax=Geodermatophilus ruber TaxID=504800 RepID=A0A1I4C5D7_9ACTN|nr:DUF5994 family protein [Geodermatophilus ruber]SFK75321.1 hypothetical protein SAMN04488085_103315 [Geodermatophilus ruber]